MQGQSLVPLLRGTTSDDWRKTFYYHYYEAGGHGVPVHYGVTDGKHKLVRFPDEKLDAWELFDLTKDPDEMRSVYDDQEYAERVPAFKKELARLRKKFGIIDDD